MLFNNLKGKINVKNCKMCKIKKEAEGLDYPPYPGPLGQKILKIYQKKLGLDGWSIKLCLSMRIV